MHRSKQRHDPILSLERMSSVCEGATGKTRLAAVSQNRSVLIRQVRLPEFGAGSCEEEIIGMQRADLHTHEYELIVLIKGDDHAVSALVTMCVQGGEV